MKAPFEPQMGLDQDEAQLTILDSILGTLLTPHTRYIHQQLRQEETRSGRRQLELYYYYYYNTY